MAFYEPLADGYVAQEDTRGPWHPQFQHAGPVSALLAHELEKDARDMAIVRFTVDLLKPVPIAHLRIRIRERLGGRRRRIVDAWMLDPQDQAVAQASALFLRQQPLELEALPELDPESPRPPQDCPPTQFDFFKAERGYHTAMEQRLCDGGPGSGRSRIWMRQRIPLVAGEDSRPLERLLVVADSGNGVSYRNQARDFTFMNADLTVNVRRPAAGEWLCLDAMTHLQPQSLGMAESRIWDRDGVVANGCQNLLIQAREGQ